MRASGLQIQISCRPGAPPGALDAFSVTLCGEYFLLFAEGFNSPVSGIAAGVLYHDGWVYVTAIPDVWRLKDTDGDGVPDFVGGAEDGKFYFLRNPRATK